MRRLAAIIVFVSGGVAAAEEPLPPGAVLRLGDTRFRARGEIRHLRFSTDGTVLFGWVVGPDGTLHPTAWDGASGTSASAGGVGGPPDDPPRTTPAAWLGGNRVVTAGPGRAARVWDAGTGRQLAALVGHSSAVTAVTVSADGKRIATGSADGLVRVWAADTFHPLSPAIGHTGAVRAVRVSADGRRALTLGDDGTARVWDLATGRELRGFQTAGLADLTADGNFVVLPAPGGCRLRDIVTGLEVVPSYPPAEPEESLAERLGRIGLTAAGSPDGRILALALRDGRIGLYESATGEERRVLPGHGTACRGLAFAPDGRRLLSAGADHTVLVWAIGVRDVPLPEVVRSETRASRLWEMLAGGPASAAYLAMARFAAEPAAAVKMARRRLDPADAGADREAALADSRGIELLESLGTADAREFLEELAAGDPIAPRTLEARRALLRLKGHTGGK